MSPLERLVWQGRAQLVLLSLILFVLVTGSSEGELNAGELTAAAGALLYGLVRVVSRFAGSTDAGDE